MIQPIINNSYLVELNMATVGVNQTFTFQSVPQLNGVSFYGIQAFSATDLAKSPNAATVISTLGMSGLVLTMVEDTTEDVYKYLLYDLRPGNVSGLIRMFANKKFVLTKSYVTCLDTTNLSAGQSMMFQFLYSPAANTR